LIKTLSLYPYNERVILNSGEIGIVVDVRPDSLSRPVVQLVGADPGMRTAPRYVDLAENPSLSVVRSIPADSVSYEVAYGGGSEQGASQDG
jgi:hypothetical protein